MLLSPPSIPPALFSQTTARSHARICRIDDEVTREFWIGGRLTAPPYLAHDVLYTPLYSGILATRLSTRHRAFVSNLDSPPHAIGVIGSELVIVT